METISLGIIEAVYQCKEGRPTFDAPSAFAELYVQM